MISKTILIIVFVALVVVVGAAFLLPQIAPTDSTSGQPLAIQQGVLPGPARFVLPDADVFSDLERVDGIISVTGNITDLDTGFVQGVVVLLNTGEVATTDGKGNYSIETVYAGETVVSFEKEGYVPVHKTVFLGTDDEINVLLQKETPRELIDLSQEIDVQQDGASLKANANSFVVKETGLAAEDATVSLTAFDPTLEEERAVFPGDFEGVNITGESVGLESFGFAKISVENSAGEKLDLADGQIAEITIPISPSQTNAPETIPLWYFDTDHETWVEAGTALKRCNGNDCFYTGKIDSIASWWNCDMPSLTSVAKGVGQVTTDAWNGLGNFFGKFVQDWYDRFDEEKANVDGEFVIEDEQAKAFIEAIRRLEEMYPDLSATEIANAVNFGIQNPWDYETGFFGEVLVDEDDIRAAGFIPQFEIREGGIAHSNKDDYVSSGLDVDLTHVTGAAAAMQGWDGSGLGDRAMSFIKGFAYSHGGDFAQVSAGYVDGYWEGLKTLSWPSRDFAAARSRYSSDQQNGDSLAMLIRKAIIVQGNTEKLSDLVEFATWRREKKLKGNFSGEFFLPRRFPGREILFQETGSASVCSNLGVCIDGNFLETENTDDAFVFFKKHAGETSLVFFVTGEDAENEFEIEANPEKTIEINYFSEPTTGVLSETGNQHFFTATKLQEDGMYLRVMVYSEQEINKAVLHGLLDGVYYSPDSASSQTRDAVLENQLAEYSGQVKAKLKTRGIDYTGYSSIDIMPTSSTFDFEVPVRENSKLELVFAVKNYESFPEQIESGAQDALTNVGTISFRFGMESCAIAEFPAPCMIDYAEIFESTAIIEKTRISSVLDLIDDESKRARAYMYMAMFYKDDAFCDEIKESYYYSQCIGDLSAKTGSIDTCLKNLDGDSSIKQFDAFKCIEGIDPNKELDYGALVSAIEQKPKPVHRLYFFLGEYYNTDRFCDNVSPSESGAPTCYKDTGVALKNVDTCLRALETTHSNRQWYTGWCIEQADESQVQDYVVLVEKIKSKPLPLDEVYSRVGGFYGDERYCENIDPSNDHAPECFRDAGITANDIDVCLRSIETTHENNVWYASWCVKLVDKDAQLDFDTLLAKINAKPGNKDYLFHELAEHYSDTRYCDSIADTSFFYLNCE